MKEQATWINNLALVEWLRTNNDEVYGPRYDEDSDKKED